MQISSRTWIPAVVLGAAALGGLAWGLYEHERGATLQAERDAARAQARQWRLAAEELQGVAPAPEIRTVLVEAPGRTDAAAAPDATAAVAVPEPPRESDGRRARAGRSFTNEPPRPDGERRNWMEDLKQSDPEQYDEIVKRREAMRQQVDDAYARKAGHLSSRDTAALSEEEQESHARLVQLMGETWTMVELMRAELPREERWTVMRAMRDNMRELTPLLQAERDSEFLEMGRALGYDDDEAATFADKMHTIVDATSLESLFPGPGGGRFGGMRPPGEGGGGPAAGAAPAAP